MLLLQKLPPLRPALSYADSTAGLAVSKQVPHGAATPARIHAQVADKDVY